jgi:putative (di)nucleoside polyphosphate hydrolase
VTGLALTAEPDPAYRRNVGLMLLNAQGLAWVGQRLDRTDDAWQMPQGGIDAGETPEAAALRELEEEIGTAKAEILCELPGWLTYDLPPDLAARFWKGRWRGQAQRWFTLRFTGADRDIDIATKHPEFGAWRWVPRAELPHLIVPFKRPVYEAVVALFEPQLRALGL